VAITITDTFDDGVIDTTIWSAYRGPCAEEGGNALIPAESGIGSRLATANNLNLTGDSVFCRVAALPTSANPASSLVMGINAVDNANEYNSYLAIQVQGTTITYRYTTSFTNNDTTATFDPVNHKWWRIREAAGSTLWETAPDDGTGLAPGTFTTRRTVANPMTVTAMRCELKCQDNSAGLHGQCFEVSHFRTSGQAAPAYSTTRPGHHRLAIGSSSANLTAYAGQYDSLVVQADKWLWRDQVKSINSATKVFAYKDAAGVSNVSGTRRDGGTTYMTGVSKTQADAGGTTWYLHSTAAGGIASDPTSRIQFADFPGVYAANIALAAYQTAWINNTISDLANGQFDGVFIDDMNPSMGNHAGGGVGDVAEYPSDATYGAAFDSFVAAVVPALRTAGYLVIGNFGPFWGDRANQTRMNQWLSSYDFGGMDEFFVKWRDLTFHTPDQIVGQLENARHALSRGRSLQLNVPGQAGQTSTPGAKLAMACVWLVTRDQARTTTFWDRTNGAYTDWDTFPEQDANLGLPVAPYRVASNGLFFRQFTNGEVWANVTGSTQTATFFRARPSDGATSASVPTNDSVIFDYGTVTSGAPVSTALSQPPKPSLELFTEVEAPEGQRYRWDANRPDPGDRPMNLRFGTKIGEGFSNGGCQLARRIDGSYNDLGLVNNVVITGADGSIVYEGRIAGTPRDLSDTSHRIGVSFQGWMSHASDDKNFIEIYCDRDLSAWGPASAKRKLNLMAAAYSPVDPTTSHDPSTGEASVQTTVSGSWTSPYMPICEAWYDAGIGMTLGWIYVSWRRTTVASTDSNWVWAVLGSTDDQASNTVSLGSLRAAGPAVAAPLSLNSAPCRFAFVQFYYAASPAGADGVIWAIDWYNIAVHGSHFLTPVTGDPAQPPGLYLSDIIKDIVGRFCPQLNTLGVETNNYVVQHAAFKDPTSPYDALLDLNKYALWHMGVWDNHTFTFRPYDLTDYQWEIRTDDPGITFDPQGPEAGGVYNGVAVTYTNVTTRVVERITPATNAALRDTSVTNPWNQWGIDHWKEITLTSPTLLNTAVNLAAAVLADANRPKTPGTLTVKGHIRDRAGIWQPVWKVRAGDAIAITDFPNDDPRLIVETDYDDEAKQIQLSVDQPFALVDAYIARQDNALRAAGLQ
jgi:hypothetical protein